MSGLPFERTGYAAEDARARLERDREAEHVHAIAEREAERLYEHRPARPDPKPAKRVKRSNAPRPDRLWRERVLERDQGCCVHHDRAECREGWQAHHVVYQKELRKTRTGELALWDVRSGMGICGLAHRRHHSGYATIPVALIPTEVVEYLSGLGYGLWIEYRYAS